MNVSVNHHKNSSLQTPNKQLCPIFWFISQSSTTKTCELSLGWHVYPAFSCRDAHLQATLLVGWFLLRSWVPWLKVFPLVMASGHGSIADVIQTEDQARQMPPPPEKKSTPELVLGVGINFLRSTWIHRFLTYLPPGEVVTRQLQRDQDPW